MTTAEALRFATFRIFSLNVQFPEATSATQAVFWGTGGNLTFGSQACLSCGRDGTRSRPLTSFLGECSPYRPHSVFSILTSELTGSRYVMLTNAVYHSSFSATVKSRHSKWTKLNDSSHVERARLRQARTTDGAIVVVRLVRGWRLSSGSAPHWNFLNISLFQLDRQVAAVGFHAIQHSPRTKRPVFRRCKRNPLRTHHLQRTTLCVVGFLSPRPGLARQSLSRDPGGAKAWLLWSVSVALGKKLW